MREPISRRKKILLLSIVSIVLLVVGISSYIVNRNRQTTNSKAAELEARMEYGELDDSFIPLDGGSPTNNGAGLSQAQGLDGTLGNRVQASNALVPALRCILDSTSSCIDFRRADLRNNTVASSNVQYKYIYRNANGVLANDMPTIAHKINNNDVRVKAIQPGGTLEIKLPAFGVDGAGFPIKPVILQISYNDTFNNSSSPNNTITVSAGTNYQLKGYPANVFPPGKIPGKTQTTMFASIGGAGDNTWKNIQYAFPQGPFPLLQAKDGYFTIIINYPKYSNLRQVNLPLYYVALKTATEEEMKVIAEKNHPENANLNLKRVAHPKEIYPVDPMTYIDKFKDPNLVLFTRDIMQPTYPDTLPPTPQDLGNTPGLTLSTLATLGEVEAMSFGIYSKGGVGALDFEVSNLRSRADPNKSFPKENISLYYVAPANRHIDAYQAWKFSDSLPYSLVPDRLQPVSSLTVTAGVTRQVWVKIKVPTTGYADYYSGTITVKKGSQVVRRVPIAINILPIKLERSKHLNPANQDPFSNRFFSSNFEEVLNLYEETNIDPYIASTYRIGIAPNRTNPNRISTFSTSVTFDTSYFDESIRIMKSRGIIGDKAVVETVKIAELLYLQVYTGTGKLYNASNKNIFDDIRSGTPFFNEYVKLIRELNAIGRKHNIEFIYSAGDEPQLSTFRRLTATVLYSHIRHVGSKTTATYDPKLDQPIPNPTEPAPIPFALPTGYNKKLPALTNLVDYRIWHLFVQDGALKDYPNDYDGYYTTYTSHLRNPVYNRFMHGWLAERSGVKMVQAYALADIMVDPYNDFDQRADRPDLRQPDYIMLYPTTDKPISAMNLEGVREGIKDSMYIATLEKLISRYPNNKNVPEAKQYLAKIKNRVKPNYFASYVSDAYYTQPEKNLPPLYGDEFGFAHRIVAGLSDTYEQQKNIPSNPRPLEPSWSIFTQIRSELWYRIYAIGKDEGLFKVEANSCEAEFSQCSPQLGIDCCSGLTCSSGTCRKAVSSTPRPTTQRLPSPTNKPVGTYTISMTAVPSTIPVGKPYAIRWNFAYSNQTKKMPVTTIIQLMKVGSGGAPDTVQQTLTSTASTKVGSNAYTWSNVPRLSGQYRFRITVNDTFTNSTGTRKPSITGRIFTITDVVPTIVQNDCEDQEFTQCSASQGINCCSGLACVPNGKGQDWCVKTNAN